MDATTLARFWSVPAYLDYVQEPLTEAAVAAAEAQLGVTLPALYLALLRVQNGGYLRGGWPGHHLNTVYGIGDRFPSLTRDEAWWRPRNVDAGQWAPEGADRLIPFDGDGHTNLCFDYRTCGAEGEPSIAFVDCELRNERTLADGLAAYLSGLVDEQAEAATRLYGDVELGDVAKRLAKHLGVEEPFFHRGQGYPLWRLKLSDAPTWCWLTPNEVPTGYRHEGQRLVVTDRVALRLPDDPNCVGLVNCSEAAQEQVAAALSALSLV